MSAHTSPQPHTPTYPLPGPIERPQISATEGWFRNSNQRTGETRYFTQRWQAADDFNHCPDPMEGWEWINTTEPDSPFTSGHWTLVSIRRLCH